MALPVLIKRTRLGGNIGGKFDFYFDGVRILITVPVCFKFEAGINATAALQFKEKYKRAILNFWTNSGFGLKVSGNYGVPFIPIIISSPEVKTNAYFTIDVKAKPMRASLRFDMNVHVGETERTIAHEFGHCLAIHDEYYTKGTWWQRVENLSPTKRLEFKSDVFALMNLGDKIRPRYFEHICKTAQRYLPGHVKLHVGLL